ncbi:hypothetical protein A3852_19545 [Rhodococcus qingshengii]|nr:hypothetical protein A3852_19545 [Rhodococcus qingshengii]
MYSEIAIHHRAGPVCVHALRMRTPSLPKAGPWTEDDEAHLQKVFATFPVWNSEQIAVARRAFQSAIDRRAALDAEEQGNTPVGVLPTTGGCHHYDPCSQFN